MNRPFCAVLACLPWLLGYAVEARAEPLDAEVRRLIDAGEPRAAVALIDERSPEAARQADEWLLAAQAYQAWMDEAGLLKKRGLANKMRRSLETALTLEPEHVEARRELADFYHYAPGIVGGSKREARRQLAILEQVDAAAAWATRGAHARSAGDRDLASDHYRRALELGPRKPAWLQVLAVLEQNLGDYPASVALLEEAIAADPEREEAYYYRARAAAMTGEDLERGLECARRYLEICTDCDDPDRAFGWWRQATILKRQGKRADAVAAYREALRFDPELEGARKGLEELEP